MDDERVLIALAGLADRLGRLETGQTGVGARLEGMDGRLEGMEGRLEGMEGRLGRMDARLDRMENSTTTLRVDLMARMDRLENSLTDIRNDIVVNLGGVDAVKRVHDNTREELRLMGDQMSMLFKKIQRLETRVREITGDP
jgi:uncharacterized protein (UPF0335 family)